MGLFVGLCCVLAMAASLAGRLQRPHHKVVSAHNCVLNKGCGGSKRSSRVRLHAALWGHPNGGLSESRFISLLLLLVLFAGSSEAKLWSNCST